MSIMNRPNRKSSGAGREFGTPIQPYRRCDPNRDEHNSEGRDIELVPARMVNEFVYCPRLAYLEWVQGEFAVNHEVAEGRFLHRNVDQVRGAMPLSDEATDNIHARSVWLSSKEERLTAVMDLIEGDADHFAPVDYKRGSVPDLPERAWLADRVQLCAQGLILRANGYPCDQGVLYYRASRTRVSVVFDEALITATRTAVHELLELAQKGTIPRPLQGSPKCVRCSLAAICLPDEMHALTATPTDPSPPLRRLIPAAHDAMPLYVQDQGARIGLKGEVFEIKQGKTKLGQARIFETSHVCVFGNVQVTTQALQQMCHRGIPLTLFSSGGWFYGLAHGMSHKNVELRLAQFRTATDPQAALALASTMVATKIENCRTFLKRNHATPAQNTYTSLKHLAREARRAQSMAELLGVEGTAARDYFSSFQGMLKGKQAEGMTFDFEGRNRRPPLDPVNCLLSYAYSLLAKDLTVTLLAVGFDPMLGVYHQPRYGRPSLALDLMEEFRPIVADSVVVHAINNAMMQADDFIQRGPAVMLKPNARKRFLHAYEQRLSTPITHPIFGYRISYRRVLEVQARLLARAISGEIDAYPGFKTR